MCSIPSSISAHDCDRQGIRTRASRRLRARGAVATAPRFARGSIGSSTPSPPDQWRCGACLKKTQFKASKPATAVSSRRARRPSVSPLNEAVARPSSRRRQTGCARAQKTKKEHHCAQEDIMRTPRQRGAKKKQSLPRPSPAAKKRRAPTTLLSLDDDGLRRALAHVPLENHGAIKQACRRLQNISSTRAYARPRRTIRVSALLARRPPVESALGRSAWQPRRHRDPSPRNLRRRALNPADPFPWRLALSPRSVPDAGTAASAPTAAARSRSCW